MPGMQAPTQVVQTDARVVDMFAKAGVNLTTGAAPANLAQGRAATASYTASGTTTAAAVDGYTINDPIWGAKGSANAQDWYEINLGSSQTFNEVRLHFRNDRAAGGYAEPAMYQIQYHDGSTWVTVPNQAKSPAAPVSNYNRVRFPAIGAQRVRVLMTHRAGLRTGLTEVKIYNSAGSPPAATNQAPYVLARKDPAYNQPAQVRLLGTVKDDALPNGTLSTAWSLVGGPGTAVFTAPTAAVTLASFTVAGTYTVRLTASDGTSSATSDVTVTVTQGSGGGGGAVNVAGSAIASASYTSPWESVNAINDGFTPASSNDSANPRWGTWPETGTQWAELTWSGPQRLNSAELYFFDDNGGVRVPASWRLQYWNGSAYADVAGASGYPTAVNAYNRVTFTGVTTTRLRVLLQSGAGSVGLLEVKVYATESPGEGGGGTGWSPPASLVTPLNQVWQHVESTYNPGPSAFRNYGWDQVMANGGSINYCVRWDSSAPVSATLRDQIHASLARQFKKWMDVMAGHNGWPYANVPVKVVGWAVRDRATLQWSDSSVDVYVNDIRENAPPVRPALRPVVQPERPVSQLPRRSRAPLRHVPVAHRGYERRRGRRLGPAHRQ
ncbi:discoidin domain-containing protein [Streptosporangium sp. NPDC001681]|uniref:discoidin domain-containing protein n=1 Tax=Streptosporangium sp. NPDC001681 TaxID=3154395 RepID=UPI00332585CF